MITAFFIWILLSIHSILKVMRELDNNGSCKDANETGGKENGI